MKLILILSILISSIIIIECSPVANNDQEESRKSGGAHKNTPHKNTKPETSIKEDGPPKPESLETILDKSLVYLREGILLTGNLGNRIFVGEEKSKQGRIRDRKLLARLDRYRDEVTDFYGNTRATLQEPDFAFDIARVIIKQYLKSASGL